MNSMRSGLWVGMLGLLVIESALAEPITVNQLIALKRMGYSDEQVAQEAVKSVSDAAAESGAATKDSRIDLNADAISQLQAAGAGDLLINALCNIAKKTTTQDVLEMAKAQQSQEQMVESIIASCPSPCSRPGITVDEARLLVTQQIPAAAIVALSGKPLGPQQLIMLGEAKTPPEIFDNLADAQGFEHVTATEESTTVMTEAGVPAHTIVALAGMPLVPQQLIMLGQAKTPPDAFDKLADALGFEPVRPTPESTTAMTEAGVPEDIIARMEKAAAEKELHDYEIAHEAWTKEVAPYTHLCETLVADAKAGDKLTLQLPDLRELTAALLFMASHI